LDIKVTQLTNEFFPWKLDRLNVTNAATNNSQNDIDNFERIDIPSPSGRYKIQITHKGTLVNSLQNYSLVITGISKVIKSEVMINPTQSCN